MTPEQYRKELAQVALKAKKWIPEEQTPLIAAKVLRDFLDFCALDMGQGAREVNLGAKIAVEMFAEIHGIDLEAGL